MAQAINKSKKQANGTVLFAKRPDFTKGSKLVGHHVVPGRNGKPDHVALDFEDGASVIYPNGWQPNFDIVIGCNYAAEWNNGKFSIKQA